MAACSCGLAVGGYAQIEEKIAAEIDQRLIFAAAADAWSMF
jgi:hypothetical protein